MATDKAPTYPQGQYDAFTAALRKILRVTHSDMMERLAAEKKAKTSKPPSSSRVSRGKG
jgi:hypothetical protein